MVSLFLLVVVLLLHLLALIVAVVVFASAAAAAVLSSFFSTLSSSFSLFFSSSSLLFSFLPPPSPFFLIHHPQMSLDSFLPTCSLSCLLTSWLAGLLACPSNTFQNNHVHLPPSVSTCFSIYMEIYPNMKIPYQLFSHLHFILNRYCIFQMLQTKVLILYNLKS